MDMEMKNKNGDVVATVRATPGGYEISRMQKRTNGQFVNLGYTFTKPQVESIAHGLLWLAYVPSYEEWKTMVRSARAAF